MALQSLEKRGGGHKDKARQSCSWAHLLPFPLLIFPSPLHHFHTISSLATFSCRSFLTRPLFSGTALQDQTRFYAMYCWVRFPAKHSASRDTRLALAQAYVARALVNWQSSWKLNTLDCEIKGIAAIWLVRSLQNVMSQSPEGKKEDWREITGCELLYPAGTFSEVEERRF